MRSAAMALAVLLGVAVALPAEAARKALVIGNSAYKAQPLANPVNDATDMAARLKALGFDVVTATNATRSQMAVAILDFQKRLAAGDEAVVFYAGHGVQVNGTNYLMPVDAEPGSEAEVEFVAIDLDRVLRILNSTGTSANLLLLDACRNNPFEQKFRGGARGLARVESASGTLISYAAAPGTVAADGRGRNSPYTQAVLTALEEPGLTVEDVLKRVHVAVRRSTGDRQTTWQEGQIVGRLVLNAEAPKVAPPTPAPPPAAALDPAMVELRFWESADRGGSVGAYEAYLARYPDGIFAGLARARVAELKGPSARPPAAAPVATPVPAPVTAPQSAPARPAAAPTPVATVAAPAPVPAQPEPPAGGFRSPAEAEGRWEGDRADGVFRLVIEREGRRVRLHLVVLQTTSLMMRTLGPGDRVECDDAELRPDGSLRSWCRPDREGVQVIGDGAHYRVAGASVAGGGTYEVRYFPPGASVAIAAGPAVDRPAAAGPAGATAAPATPTETRLAALSPSRDDGTWEAVSADGGYRLVLTRRGGDVQARIVNLQPRSATVTGEVLPPGHVFTCDSVRIDPGGQTDGWCGEGRYSGRSKLSGAFPRVKVLGTIGNGDYALRFVPSEEDAARIEAERRATR
ncbi:MAG: caspase domain-containing protein [Alphaproteobacteria bacterium]